MNTESTPQNHEAPDRHLGRALRATQHAIRSQFHDAFRSEGVTRRDWMALNVVDGSIAAPGLRERLERRGKRLAGLKARGWVTRENDGWTLTPEGREAKDRLAGRVESIREKVRESVSDEDYATTLATLDAITEALGGDPQDGFAPMGFGRRSFGARGRGFGHGPRHGHVPHAGHRCGPHDGFESRHGKGPRRAERAFERGFTAGFERGTHERTDH